MFAKLDAWKTNSFNDANWQHPVTYSGCDETDYPSVDAYAEWIRLPRSASQTIACRKTLFGKFVWYLILLLCSAPATHVNYDVQHKL